MNVGYKHTSYNYKFFNCSWTMIHVQYQKVHFFFKSTAQENFLATGLHTKHIPEVLSVIKPHKITYVYKVNYVYFINILHHNTGRHFKLNFSATIP